MSIFSKIGGFFKRLFGAEQNWEKAASITLSVATPLAATLLDLTAGAGVSAEVVGVINQVQADLKTVNSIVATAGSSPTATSTLNSVLANLKSLETSLDIKDPTRQQAVTLITTTLIDEIEAVIAEIPALSPEPPTTPAIKK